MGVYAEQWADALHQWLGITDDCVHMVAKVSVMSSELMQKFCGWRVIPVVVQASKIMHGPLQRHSKSRIP